MAKNELTTSRYFGRVCDRHPEFRGLRLKSDQKCVQCQSERATSKEYKRMYLKEKGYLKTYLKTYLKEKGYRRASARNRQIAKHQRIPSWADRSAIRKFYNNCPEGMEVDHIIPLRGVNVSGFHVLNNLQYLDSAINRGKSNKYDS